MIQIDMAADVNDTISVGEAKAACECILASHQFRRAPRMRRLLRFLVDQAISVASPDMSEYFIGIEVFDRDPAVYSTSEDPVVRVQIGRLREKLKSYYASLGAAPDVEFSIPLGAYVPLIRRIKPMASTGKHVGLLAIHQIRCIPQHGEGVPFTQGLYDELVHQLFKAFGKIIVAHPSFQQDDSSNANWFSKRISGIGVNHLLEGSIRIDAARIRASVRLVDPALGYVAWSEQFDRNNFFAIPQQEELALSICGELKRFYSIA